MDIQVRLLGPFNKFGKGHKDGKISLKEGTRLNELIAELKLPPKSIKLIFINGKVAHRDAVISDGDTVVFFPPVSGG